MAYKNIEDSRAASRRHYANNKKYYCAKNQRRRAKILAFVREIKSSTPCTDCKQAFPFYVMDFDHLSDKIDAVAIIMRSGNIPKIKAEIAKCELVCSNCHRGRTFSRRQK